MNCSALGFSATIQGELATLARGSPELPLRREEGRRRREWLQTGPLGSQIQQRQSQDRVKWRAMGDRQLSIHFNFRLFTEATL